MPSRVIATLLALVAFTAATAAGVIAQNTAWTILWRASLAMIVCYCLGRIVGVISQRALHEHLEQYKSANPIPAEFQPPEQNDTEPEEASGEIAAAPDAVATRAAA